MSMLDIVTSCELRHAPVIDHFGYSTVATPRLEPVDTFQVAELEKRGRFGKDFLLRTGEFYGLCLQ